jgi:fructokinase
VVVGTGFLPLDVVITDADAVHAHTWAGGTSGNVLAILAYLGWKAYPVARLGDDAAADTITSDLAKFGVATRFIQRDPNRNTPIIIQRIRQTATGVPRSRFVWKCPECGSWFPGFQPVLARDVEGIVAALPAPTVFFFDRVSRSSIDLAAAAEKRGALVMFEPSGVGDEKLFREALALAHVLKYSRDRLPGLVAMAGPLLQIETRGAEGLRYRLRRGAWRAMPGLSVSKVKDTVGAGDWCTAGLLQGVGVNGAAGLRGAPTQDVARALRTGQALAALTCVFEGARGGMYAMDRRQFRAAIETVASGGSPVAVDPPRADLAMKELWRAVCPSCAKSRRRSPAA